MAYGWRAIAGGGDAMAMRWRCDGVSRPAVAAADGGSDASRISPDIRIIGGGRISVGIRRYRQQAKREKFDGGSMKGEVALFRAYQP
jgi:hypothetical protein